MKLVHAMSKRSLQTQRLEALLGATPTLTFHAPAGDSGDCCSIRLVRGTDDLWFGAVRDRSSFAERAQRDDRFHFVAYHDGETPLACGEVKARIRGRIGTLLEDEIFGSLLTDLMNSQPFISLDWQMVEFKIDGVRLDEGEAPLHGAVPRT